MIPAIGGEMLKKITGRFAVLLFVVASSSTGWAARYFVSVNNKDVFAQIHAQYTLREKVRLNTIQANFNGEAVRPFDGVPALLETSLKNLNSVIVETNDPDAVQNLKRSPYVEFVEAEMFHPAPRPIQGFHRFQPWDLDLNPAILARKKQKAPKMPWGIKTVKAPEAWQIHGQGAGVRALVLDTGIDPTHPALAANFEKGQDFTGENDFIDKHGHGTHVSGTVAGRQLSGGFAGVAPETTLLMGRVCSSQGCSNFAVASGINWGITEKVSLITMSLGGPLGSMAEKRAVEAALQAGIPVVAATGNDGSGKISYPAAFDGVIAVGAIDPALHRASFSQYGPQLSIMAPGVDVISAVPMGSGRESKVTVISSQSSGEVASKAFVGSPEVKTPMSNELVDCGLALTAADFPAEVQGKFALVQRGQISFADKVTNAIAAGAAGVVLYNNAPGLIQGTVTQDGSLVAIPVIMIEQAVGETLRQEIQAGLRPGVTLQTIPIDYAAFDGTSMATPHVAGVVALVKAANANLTPAEVKTILLETAQPLGPQLEYGAGVVNAAEAVSKTLGAGL